MWLFVLFLTIPLIEIALFIQVGGLIGVGGTIALTLLTALAGTALVRRQGMTTLGRLQAQAEAGEDPSVEILGGALILLAGLLLLTPGFFTDGVGLLLLIPPVRLMLIRRFASRIRGKSFTFGRGPQRRSHAAARETIETDYEVLDDVPPAKRGASGWTRTQY
jgi:UPF0716 protein FxsA